MHAQVRSLARTRIVSVACGGNHTLAISEAGDLWACGRGRHGQLGMGSFQDSAQLRVVPRLQCVLLHTPYAPPFMHTPSCALCARTLYKALFWCSPAMHAAYVEDITSVLLACKSWFKMKNFVPVIGFMPHQQETARAWPVVDLHSACNA
jgi:hypothetical protein